MVLSSVFSSGLFWFREFGFTSLDFLSFRICVILVVLWFWVFFSV